MDAIVGAVSGPRGQGIGGLQDVFADLTPDKLSEVLNNVYIKIKDATGKKIQVFLADLVSSEEWDKFYEEFKTRFEAISQTFAQLIGAAFSNTIYTNDFQNFLKSFKVNLSNSIKSSLTDAFSKQVLDQILQKTGLFGSTGVLAQYMQGDISAEDVTTDLTNSLEELNTLLPTLEPIWKEVGDILNTLNDTLGITNSALLGPVNEFLKSLEFSEFAPSMSTAQIMAEQEKLFNLASANVEDFGQYASFMQSTMLPFMQGTTTDYADLIQSIKQDVTNLDWYVAAGGVPITAESIGESVSRHLAPMLSEIAENIKEGESVVIIDSEGRIQKTLYSSLKNDSNTRSLVKNIATA